MTTKWFKKAVDDKPPYTLGGWKTTQTATTRRRLALSSRPRNWTKKHRYRSAAQALQALANVTRDKKTKLKATADAKYFRRRMDFS